MRFSVSEYAAFVIRWLVWCWLSVRKNPVRSRRRRSVFFPTSNGGCRSISRMRQVSGWYTLSAGTIRSYIRYPSSTFNMDSHTQSVNYLRLIVAVILSLREMELFCTALNRSTIAMIKNRVSVSVCSMTLSIPLTKVSKSHLFYSGKTKCST